MFAAISPPAIARVRSELLTLARRRPAVFDALFLREEAIPAGRLPAAELAGSAEAGLIRLDRHVRSAVRVNRLPDDVLIVTDLCAYAEIDQVFPIHAEQLFLIGSMRVRPGEQVLELGIGSGINAIAAVRAGAEVTGAEISPRAMEFARFNARLNGVDDRLTIVPSDWFSALGGRCFDLILSNPPFEPVPPGLPHFHHSRGGADGLDVVRTILQRFEAHLHPGGRFQCVTYTIAEDDRLLLADLCAGLEAATTIEMHPQAVPLLEFMEKYPLTPALRAEYRGKLLYLVVATIEPGRERGVAARLISAERAGALGDVIRPLGFPGRGPTVVRDLR